MIGLGAYKKLIKVHGSVHYIAKGKVFLFPTKKNKNPIFSAIKIHFAAATCLLSEKYFRKNFFV